MGWCDGCTEWTYICGFAGAVFSVNYFCRFRQLFLPVHLLFLGPFLSHSCPVTGDVEF